ncbi:hypothetical protein GCM10009793_18820 [Brachybacterium phenoliresistens]
MTSVALGEMESRFTTRNTIPAPAARMITSTAMPTQATSAHRPPGGRGLPDAAGPPDGVGPPGADGPVPGYAALLIAVLLPLRAWTGPTLPRRPHDLAALRSIRAAPTGSEVCLTSGVPQP